MKKLFLIVSLILVGQICFCFNPSDYGLGRSLDRANQTMEQLRRSRESYERSALMQQERDLQMQAYLNTLPRGIIDYNKIGQTNYVINKFQKLEKYNIELQILTDNKFLSEKQIKEYVKIENKKDKDYKDKIKIDEFKEENLKLTQEYLTLDKYLSNKDNINNEDYKDKEKRYNEIKKNFNNNKNKFEKICKDYEKDYNKIWAEIDKKINQAINKVTYMQCKCLVSKEQLLAGEQYIDFTDAVIRNLPNK